MDGTTPIPRIVGHVVPGQEEQVKIWNLDHYRERADASRKRAKLLQFSAALLSRNDGKIKSMLDADGWLRDEWTEFANSTDRDGWIKRKLSAMKIEAGLFQREADLLLGKSAHDVQWLDAESALRTWGQALAEEKSGWDSFMSAAIDVGAIRTYSDAKGMALREAQTAAFKAWREFLVHNGKIKMPRKMASRLSMFQNWGDTNGRIHWGQAVKSVKLSRFKQMWESYRRRH